MKPSELFYKFLCEEGILFDVIQKISPATLTVLFEVTDNPLNYTHAYFWDNVTGSDKGYDFWNEINKKWTNTYLKHVGKTIETYYEES